MGRQVDQVVLNYLEFFENLRLSRFKAWSNYQIKNIFTKLEIIKFMFLTFEISH